MFVSLKYSLTKGKNCDFLICAFSENNLIFYFVNDKNNNSIENCNNVDYKINQKQYPHQQIPDRNDFDYANFKCVYNEKLNLFHCMLNLISRSIYYEIQENEIPKILFTEEEFYYDFRKYNDDIYYKIHSTYISPSNVNIVLTEFQMNNNSITNLNSISFNLEFTETIRIKEINEKSIILYSFGDYSTYPYFFQDIYLIYLDNLIYLKISFNKQYKFIDILCTSQFFSLIENYVIVSPPMRLNNLRNLDSESLFYNYFKRPICHDINLMLSINSFINIGISELTYDENLSNYYISIINKDLIGNLNLYIQIDNLEFNINSSEIKEKIFSVKQITYYSPNEKNKDIIYFFLSNYDYNPPPPPPVSRILQDNNFIDEYLEGFLFFTPSNLCKIIINTINCYKSCEECKELGNENNHKCILCKKGYLLKQGNNCIKFEDEINSLLLNSEDKNNLNIEMNSNEALENFDLITNMELKDKNYINIIGNKTCLSKYLVSSDEKINIGNQPQIDLGECENQLRKQYNLKYSDKLFITQISYNNPNSPKNNIKFKVFDENNNELSLSICENETIIETYPISPEKYEEFNIDLYHEILTELNQNIFEPESDFYNDKCLRYYMNHRDMTLKNRREHLFKNITLCDNNCKFIEIDENENIKCECIGISSEKNSNKDLIINDSPIGDFKDSLSQYNIGIMKCIQNLFKDIGNNISFYLIFLGLITEIILTILYYKLYHSYNIKNNPPIKNDSNQIISNHTNSSVQKSDEILSINQNKKKKNSFVNNVLSSTDRNYISEKKKEIEEEISPNELNEMEYREALKNDKRNFIIMFKHFILVKQMLFLSCFSNSILYTFHLRIITIIFIVHSYLFINGLLFNDNLIGKRYDYEGKNNFSYFFKMGIQISFYSSCILLIICKICNLMISSDNKIKEYLKKYNEEPKNIEIKNDLSYEINSMRIKRKAFFVIIFILEFIYFYYLYIFNYIYKYTQIIWLISVFMTFFFNILISCFICLSIVCFRILALKKEIWILYEISDLIYNLF